MEYISPCADNKDKHCHQLDIVVVRYHNQVISECFVVSGFLRWQGFIRLFKCEGDLIILFEN